MVDIVEVKSKKQQKLFVNFQLELYKDCPYFVPPMIADELAIFNKKKNANYENCEAVFYLAYKDNVLAGRVAAILQHAYNDKTGKKIVRFSRIDFIDDFEVSKALIAAVENWAKSKGMTHVHGPLGFNDLEREGLLIDGFDQMSCFEENYYYSYYKDHFDKLGYIKDVDWIEYKIYVPDHIDERTTRLVNKISEKYGFREVKIKSLRSIVKKYKDQIFDLLNRCYDKLYGVVPINKRLEEQFASQFIMAINPRYLCLVINKEDKLIGFGLAFPSLAEAMRKSKGKIITPHIFKLLHDLKHPKVVDLALFAVDEEYRTKGVTAFIFNKILNNFIEDKVVYLESLLQLEDNIAIQNQFDDFKREFHKRRRCYIKDLTASNKPAKKPTTKSKTSKKSIKSSNAKKTTKKSVDKPVKSTKTTNAYTRKSTPKTTKSDSKK